MARFALRLVRGKNAYVQDMRLCWLFPEVTATPLPHARKTAALAPQETGSFETPTFRGDYAVARTSYAKAYPTLFAAELPPVRSRYDAFAAIELAVVLQHTGERDRARALLDRSEAFIQTIPRMGEGYGIADVAIHTLRGETATALAKLREAEQAGWRRCGDTTATSIPI